MLVEAKCKNKDITRDGTWASADVELVLKQCTKIDGTLPKPKPSKPSTPSGDTSGTSGDTAAAGSLADEAAALVENKNKDAHSASSGKAGGGGGRMVAVAMVY